ncbi:DEAD/DEAH box helicase [Thermobifida cellulosilytica]|uniref:DEAD/DEAH box helicase n=1 Tax=Thermobifida cellulosilytica TB100 TaxID=665004 RepID=A0A147KKV1_THECS|nr:DEAD/DEAH box helicase [Thermobifida cellulosilytica]KUP97950.1 DEAD/DEAH box helicase [Thermobifida cellulosilytica TB100]
MTTTLDPLGVSALISDSYRRYLRSLLPLRDRGLADALDRQIRTSPLLTKGPLLEATPPYRTGATPRQLVAEGVLSPSFAAPGGPAIHLDRPLYLHQEQAIRKARAGRDLVVATGTGSGKTESFLLPVLNELEEQHRRGELGPGVRALLLYPMNALANDQLKRLRELLSGSPHITFGRYTGETKESERDARELFRTLHRRDPLPNELISREQMQRRPPHLLLTNYAMLEYLLLRPDDLDLFEGEHAGHWRFVALDEAHVYDGAKAAELAMLLRRLRDRVAPGRRLQYIATSATVGDDPKKVTEFASRLFFKSDFEWDATDPDRQGLVTATHRTDPPGQPWGPLSAADYAAIGNAAAPETELRAAARRHGVPDGGAYRLLATEQRMRTLRTLLADGGPQPLEDLAARIFTEEDDGAVQPAALAAMVALGSRVRDPDGSPLLSARYHLFTRATEGAFTCLSEKGPHVWLSRHEHCPDCHAPAFELAACKRCGDTYLVGTTAAEDGAVRFLPQRRTQDQILWLHLGNTPITVDEDDDTLEEPAAQPTAKGNHLCVGCGALGTAARACLPGCPGRAARAVQELRSNNGRPSGCLSCGARGPDTVRRLESGNEAAAAVVATALYQALPEDPDAQRADRPGGGRKLLTFSDSRQAAAFFAPYLEHSYSLLQQRRLILEGLEHGYVPDDDFWVDDLIGHTAQRAARAGNFERRVSRQRREHAAGLWVMRELVATDDRQSLEGRGLLHVRMERPEGTRLPPALPRELGLDEDEVWDLLGELVRSLRQQGALTMPERVAPDDEAFAPRRGPIYVRLSGPDRKRKVISWLPGQGNNRRLNYLDRLLGRMDPTLDATERKHRGEKILRGVWQLLTDAAHHRDSESWLVPVSDRSLGVLWQVDHTFLSLSPVTPATRLYQCDSCRRLHPVSVRGVCPTLNCPGTLHPFTPPAPEEDDDHYRRLYRSLNPVVLHAREHTAQWSTEEASRVQENFIEGQVNVLSCSTTFELGVDVGELQAVLLRNMPPTTANYVQRAGRAGRRTDSAALVVTYAQRRSHDLSRYQEPEQMIAGQVRAPYVPLDNERIARRHAHSVALAAFFRHWHRATGETSSTDRDSREIWRTVGAFFLPGDDGSPAPVTRVPAFLTPVPEEISAALRRILPDRIAGELGVDDGRWAAKLCQRLEKLHEEVAEDVAYFERRRQEASEQRQYRKAEHFERTINTIKHRSLIGFLATRNVLPKYGFPVDTVELRTSHAEDSVGRHLELSRDLTSAIYEYAPGSEVVAGGRKWTSRGVYLLPKRRLPLSYYRVCDNCRYYEEDKAPLPPVCSSCGEEPAKNSRTPARYCVPEFGFVADPQTAAAGLVPPQRSWHGTTHVLRLAAELTTQRSYSYPGGEMLCRAGSRGQLVALSEGPGGQGFWICEQCGWGDRFASRKPSKHSSPLRDRTCAGPLKRLALAHQYETDLVDITFTGSFQLDRDDISPETRYSLLYALLEGASAALEISRDDIDGTLYHRRERGTSLVLFDTVPGGAGGGTRITEHFSEVLLAAVKRLENCDCGEETSCYGCLRTYRNQTRHELLVRGKALEALRLLV